MNLILGAGLGGLAASYHLGHDNCLLLERKSHAYGHIHTEFRDGFTWDEGPHVSFTKNDYVRDLFAASVDGDFDEYEVRTKNYFRGHWIDHPAQSNLYQIPEPLRSECLSSFLDSREHAAKASPANYYDWLVRAFGPKFSEVFPLAYTRKYWTLEAAEMTVDWVGSRIFSPEVEDVVAGSRGPLDRQTHYITKVRYPKRGGFQAFAAKLAVGAHIRLGTEVARIDLRDRRVWTTAGEEYRWDRLINTLPLPVFVSCCMNVPAEVKEAAQALACSSLLVVNITAPHGTRIPANWMYVYDEDKYATRINCTEMLATGNAPTGHTGVQTEVYFSRFRPLDKSPAEIASAVEGELKEMGMLEAGASVKTHTLSLPWANVIFSTDTAPALDTIWRWMEGYGLSRESDDLHPLTDWAKTSGTGMETGNLAMAGRFGQWKYFWTDDCVLRGRELAGRKTYEN